MQLGNEASVEDILASIKRVIARDPPPPSPPVALAAVPPAPAPTPLRDPDPVEPADAEEAAEVLALAEDAVAPLPAAPLTSDATDDALRTSFSHLAAVAGVAQDGGAPLDDLVQRALRPLLAQWLDAHLPALVERLVREEIARIAGPRG